MTTLAIDTPASFEDILDELEILARDHLLAHRLQVGDVLLQHFWAGDSRAFSSRDKMKEDRFDLFFEKCGETLARYGLSQRQARDSIRAAIVVRTLPTAVVNQLFLSQVLLLTRLRDPTQRAHVASASVARDWSLQQLRNAVEAARAGLPFDGVDAPADEPAQGAEAEALPAPGRLVTRVEKLAAQVGVWSTQWAQIEGKHLRSVQRKRLAKAADLLEVEVAELRRVIAAEMPGGGTDPSPSDWHLLSSTYQAPLKPVPRSPMSDEK